MYRFPKLVALVAYRDSRCLENQIILRDLFRWLAWFVFLKFVLTSLGVVGAFGSGLGTFIDKK